MKRGDSRHDPGFRSLALSILEQALQDYWTLVFTGAILHGKPGTWKPSRPGKDHSWGDMKQEEVEPLIQFLFVDLQDLLDLAGIDSFAAVDVKAMIQRLELNGRWRMYWGQHGNGEIGENLDPSPCPSDATLLNPTKPYNNSCC
jgi:hypothetical protein